MKRILTQNEKIDSTTTAIKRVSNYVRQINNADILVLTQAISKSKNIDTDKLISSLLEVSEKIERSVSCLTEMEQNKLIRENTTHKVYTPTNAGVYIATKLGRTGPITKAQVNNYIRQGKLISGKKGNRNYINESELDNFIDLYGGDLRSVY